VLILTFVAVVTYAITIICGFQWISAPLRTIAKGTSRIANGDTDHRLGSVSRWNDEFADLAANCNRMANRFHEAEDSLSAKVEERSRQLVRSERLAGVGFLSAGVAHEINTPLSAITIAAESLQYRLSAHLDLDHQDTAEALRRLDMIQRESKRCGQITRRLLDFARNEKQHILPHDLTHVVQEVLDMVRPMDRYSDRAVVFEETDPLILEINASQIKQVVLNLVANGLQATDAGGTVQIRLEGQTDWVIMEISDDGHGMESENIGNLFEPFFSTKETGQGTGLGLSITHRIIEEHHGTIDPYSEGPGKGSRFSIRLPRRQPQQKAA
jgi:two-component system NtrC family sensor kinase